MDSNSATTGMTRMSKPVSHVRKRAGYRSYADIVGIAILCFASEEIYCHALSSERWRQKVSSPLSSVPSHSFSKGRWEGSRKLRQNKRGRSSLNMVLTTPIDIIEQASTVNLLDDLIDESVRTSARRPIIRQFDPSSGWIWRRWKGTIFSETWRSCVRNTLYAFAIFLLYKTYPNFIDNHLSGFSTLWGQLLSVTTFTLTFFVNQSYALWRKCTELSRRLQGRLHDIGMNMATHARRQKPETQNEPSTYTPESRQILELMSRYVRMFNLFTYASFTRSHRPILTPRGMRRLVDRGLLTSQERESLVEANIPPTQRHSSILMWMIRLFLEGRASGHILGGDGFEQHTLDKFHVIRAQYGAIGDELQGRMPLAYAHIVQVLVDLILWMYPVMAFSTGMSPYLVIAGTGLLTISYQGLFDLAKQFLDPYDNETYGKGEDPLSVDTLIAETNAGSVRWLYGFEEMPFNAEQLQEGELMDCILPIRGYTLEDLAQMEEDRIKKEKEEQRQREEEDRIKKEKEVQRQREEEERLLQEAEENSEKEEQDAGESMIDHLETESLEPEVAVAEVEDPAPTEVVAEAENEHKDVNEKTVHKVVTIGGKPVSVQMSEEDRYEGIVVTSSSTANGNLDVANYLDSLSMSEVKDQGTMEHEPQTDAPEDMKQIEEEEITLVVEEQESQNTTSAKLTDEEYDEKVAAIKEAIKELNAETEYDGREEVHLVVEKKKAPAPKADEEEEPKRMSLEDYEEAVERIITEAKEEMLETEAILSTKAGLDPLGWDYEDDELTSIADDPEEEGYDDTKSEHKAREIVIMDENLDVLEMDVEEDDFAEGIEEQYFEPPVTPIVETHADTEKDLFEGPADDHLSDIEKTRRVLLGRDYFENRGVQNSEETADDSTDSGGK